MLISTADSAARLTFLQVWYSATWDTAASSAFRAATNALATDRNVEPAVRAWLRSWSNASVSLRKARDKWLERVLKSRAGIANLLQESDRDALCRYMLTGELLPTSASYADCSGSVVMFHEPSDGDAYAYAHNEDFLVTIDPEVLARQRQSSADFVAAGVAVLRRRVTALRTVLQAASLRVEVRTTFPCTVLFVKYDREYRCTACR